MVGPSLGGTYPATHIMDGEYIKFRYPLGKQNGRNGVLSILASSRWVGDCTGWRRLVATEIMHRPPCP